MLAMILKQVTLYELHGLYWVVFVLARVIARVKMPGSLPGSAGDAIPRIIAARRPGFLIAIHAIAFALMYAAIALASSAPPLGENKPTNRVIGAIFIVAAAALAAWAILHFASWRLRAQLDAGHQLATGGPFHFIQHPIYASLNLLAWGTSIWAPGLTAFAALGFMILGGELRAKAEEPLLAQRFGKSYEDYRKRTRRFIPWIY